MEDEGRFVSPEDLRFMIEHFVEQPVIGGKLIHEEKNPALYKLRLKKESRQSLLEKVQADTRMDRATLTFQRWLQGEEPFLPVTFDQKTALEDRQMPFITPLHPLARAATAFWKEQTEALTTCVSVQSDETPSGQYLFICELWDYLGIRPEIRMVSLCWDLNHSGISDEVSPKVIRLLGIAQDSSCDSLNRVS